MTSYTNKTRTELIEICKEQKIKNYSSLKKDEIVKLLLNKNTSTNTNTNTNTKDESINHISENVITVCDCDFFCGAGGFSEGFYQEGFDVVFALDYWKPAYITHEHNHKNCKKKHYSTF